MFKFPRLFSRDQRGQSMVEYGVAIALVSAVAFGAFQTLGMKTNSQFATHPLNAVVGGGGSGPAPGPVAPPASSVPAPLPPASAVPTAAPVNPAPAPSAAPVNPAPVQPLPPASAAPAPAK